MNPKALIFDFDGTIADTIPTYISILNNLSSKFGYRPASDEDIERFEHLSAKELIDLYKIPHWKLFFIIRSVKREFNKVVKFIAPFPHITHVIKKAKKDGHRLFIVSSNDTDNLEKFLKFHKVDTDDFEAFYGGVSIFGKAKVLNKLIKRYKLDRTQTFYIGDEIRDIKAAKKVKIKIISVTWGANSQESLRENNPDFLAQKPEEILNFIENN